MIGGFFSLISAIGFIFHYIISQEDNMNEIINALIERRSCRNYKSEQIKDEELNAVLEAGLYAPTAMGRQTPFFLVVQDKEIIKKMSKMNAAVMGSDKDPFYGAPTVIVVLAPKDARHGVEDGSLALGNLMNAAYALGLGSCWINRAYEVYETEEGKALLKELGVDGEWRGIGNCILGYPVVNAEKKPRNPGRVKVIK